MIGTYSTTQPSIIPFCTITGLLSTTLTGIALVYTPNDTTEIRSTQQITIPFKTVSECPPEQALSALSKTIEQNSQNDGNCTFTFVPTQHIETSQNSLVPSLMRSSLGFV